MTEPTIDYPSMIDRAMRGVVRQALEQVAATGLPGEHHFFISFNTQYPGVKISDTLKTKYPQEMTIVLQHQFWDLLVEDDTFAVTLSFNNVPEPLVVPYPALTAFADPSIKFGLQFHVSEEEGEAESFSLELGGEDALDRPSADVISLDSFRKK